MATAPEVVSVNRVRHDLWKPLEGKPTFAYMATLIIAALVVVWGLICWGYQIWNGLGVTGLQRPVFWGFYIVDFVFWIGISHAGTLISAILRLTDAGWRKPVTRAAEAITVFALMIGGLFPLIHLGRVWHFYWLIPYPNTRLLWPNFRSPLVWDLTAIMTYLTGSVVYLYLPLIPDAAELGRTATGWRRPIYRALGLGWTGTDTQWMALERAIKLMAGMILAVAISVHSVVAFDFAMSIAPMWHSTIFGPYFVAGAIFSGIAALLIVMSILRKALHLEDYLLPKHFDNLAKLLLLMSLLWLYFTLTENLTVWYGNDPKEMNVFQPRVRGQYAIYFWTMVVVNFVIPFILLGVKKFRTITTATIASVGVVIGMWLERYIIVVPTSATPRLPSAWTTYAPSWVELSITAATFAAMIVLYLLFAKLFPMVSVWEYEPEPVEE